MDRDGGETKTRTNTFQRSLYAEEKAFLLFSCMAGYLFDEGSQLGAYVRLPGTFNNVSCH